MVLQQGAHSGAPLQMDVSYIEGGHMDPSLLFQCYTSKILCVVARGNIQLVCRFSERVNFNSFASQHTIYKIARALHFPTTCLPLPITVL